MLQALSDIVLVSELVPLVIPLLIVMVHAWSHLERREPMRRRCRH